MNTHTLKCEQHFFVDILLREKRFEVRRADRNFEVGDRLALKCYESSKNTYDGRELLARIVYILSEEEHEGIAPGFVVLGLDHVVQVVA